MHKCTPYPKDFALSLEMLKDVDTNARNLMRVAVVIATALSSRPKSHVRVGLFRIPHFPSPASIRSGVIALNKPSGMHICPKNDVAELPSSSLLPTHIPQGLGSGV
jgi:hypothetical protein